MIDFLSTAGGGKLKNDRSSIGANVEILRLDEEELTLFEISISAVCSFTVLNSIKTQLSAVYWFELTLEATTFPQVSSNSVVGFCRTLTFM